MENILPSVINRTKTPHKWPANEKLGWGHLKLASKRRSKGHFESASTHLKKASQIFSSLKDDLALAVVNYELSVVERETDWSHRAQSYGKTALGFFEKNGDCLLQGWGLHNMAVIHANRFENEEALRVGKKAEKFFQKANSEIGLAWNACTLGNIEYELRNFNESYLHFSKAYYIFQRLHDDSGKAESLLGLGRVFRGQCNFSISLPLLNKSKRLFRKLQVMDRVGWCLLHEAAIYNALGDQRKSEQENKAAYRLFTRMNNQDGIAWSLIQLGLIQKEKGQILKGWGYLRRAEEIHSKIFNPKGWGRARLESERIFIDHDQADKVKSSLRSLIKRSKKIGDQVLQAKALISFSEIEFDQGRFVSGMDLLDQGTILAQKIRSYETLAEATYQRVRFHLVKGDVEKGQFWTEKLKELIQKYSLTSYQHRLNLCEADINIRQERYSSAENHLQDVWAWTEKNQHIKSHIESLFGLYQIYLIQNRNAELILLRSKIERKLKQLTQKKLKAKWLFIQGIEQWLTYDYFDSASLIDATQMLRGINQRGLELHSVSTVLSIAEADGNHLVKSLIKQRYEELIEDKQFELKAINKPQGTHPNPFISLIL